MDDIGLIVGVGVGAVCADAVPGFTPAKIAAKATTMAKPIKNRDMLFPLLLVLVHG